MTEQPLKLSGDMREIPMNLDTKHFQHNDIVRYAVHESDEAASLRFRVVEWNGDRGFCELVCDLPFKPQQLMRASEITLAESE